VHSVGNHSGLVRWGAPSLVTSAVRKGNPQRAGLREQSSRSRSAWWRRGEPAVRPHMARDLSASALASAMSSQATIRRRILASWRLTA